MDINNYKSLVFKNEADFQIATNRFINANFPELRHFYFHIPNESATSDLMRLKLHSMGILPGVPDFCFLLPHTWFLELKLPNGKLSEKQLSLHSLWKSKNIPVFTAFNQIDVIKILHNCTNKTF